MSKYSLEKTRENVLRAVSPVRQSSLQSFNLTSVRTFREILHDEYYLIFFLFIDLLGFSYLGPGEKVAYIIPVEFEGQYYSIVYGKFGMKIEHSTDGDPVSLYTVIKKGIKAAKPYYLRRAEEASTTSNLNLISKCPQLWRKYIYLKEQSKALMKKFEEDQNKKLVEEGRNDDGSITWTSKSFPAYKFQKQSLWLHECAVDAFFAWCEQALVHTAILMGRLTNGQQIAQLLRKEFGEKCKLVFDLSETNDKAAYDDILDLRAELRNYIAHGSFGKDNSAFQFHSSVGAVPLKILNGVTSTKFSFGVDGARDWESDYNRIDDFISQLWSKKRGPAQQYLQTGIPSILPFTKDGTYIKAMKSVSEMEELILFLSQKIDDSANMDF